MSSSSTAPVAELRADATSSSSTHLGVVVAIVVEHAPEYRKKNTRNAHTFLLVAIQCLNQYADSHFTFTDFMHYSIRRYSTHIMRTRTCAHERTARTNTICVVEVARSCVASFERSSSSSIVLMMSFLSTPTMRRGDVSVSTAEHELTLLGL